jgi:rare lipoprotein A
MVSRMSAALCGVAIIFFSFAAMAQSKFCAGPSCTADRVALGTTIVGAASMYNPFRPGYREGGIKTASGERYDPSAWTAAIQISLRHNFGGVRHGRSPSYALVEGMNKKVIVKINDVGPLMPGRVIDFNEQTMRHFDPTLRLGLIRNVKVTALRGSDWTPGPVDEG